MASTSKDPSKPALSISKDPEPLPHPLLIAELPSFPLSLQELPEPCHRAAKALINATHSEVADEAEHALSELGFVWSDRFRSNYQIAPLIHRTIFNGGEPNFNDPTSSISPLIATQWLLMSRMSVPQPPYAYMLAAIRCAALLIHFSFLSRFLPPTTAPSLSLTKPNDPATTEQPKTEEGA